MEKIYIFDVDGTLTPSRLQMTEKFKNFFEEWVKRNNFYLVTGSDLPKLQEQMNSMEIHSSGIFTCCGNQFWQSDPAVHPKHCDLIYDNKFELTDKLKTMLNVVLMASPYPDRYGNHIEDRGSMVNFSIVGRDCNQMQREIFFEWDNKNGERKKIATAIKEKFPELDAVLGGQISIDIYPKGMDKSQVLSHIRDDNIVSSMDEYIFIGDRTDKSGNDYPLAKLMNETDNCSYYQTEGWEKTIKILKELELNG